MPVYCTSRCVENWCGVESCSKMNQSFWKAGGYRNLWDTKLQEILWWQEYILNDKLCFANLDMINNAAEMLPSNMPNTFHAQDIFNFSPKNETFVDFTSFWAPAMAINQFSAFLSWQRVTTRDVQQCIISNILYCSAKP